MMKIEEMKCVNCRYWNEVYFGDGICRKYSPKVFQFGDFNNGITVETRYPACNSQNWCGEFKNK